MFFYKDEEIDEADGNIFFQVIGCVWHGAVQKIRGRSFRTSTNNSWIDGSIGRYPEQFVHDVSAFLKVLHFIRCIGMSPELRSIRQINISQFQQMLKLFIPLPLYWALFAQIDSNWTFQSAQLNTTVLGYHFQADQVSSLTTLTGEFFS